jgi:thiosulfate/3-mercaptopyruvate sulfurtransferase
MESWRRRTLRRRRRLEVAVAVAGALAACSAFGVQQQMMVLKDTVSTAWLAENLHDPSVKIVDVRGKVLKKEVSPGEFAVAYAGERSSYLDGHIPSASYVDWTTDIARTDKNGVAVQLADAEQFLPEMEMRGVTFDKHIVLYDDGRCLFATRMWWALRVYGKERDVSILDGGWDKWVAEDRPIDSDEGCPLKMYEQWGGPEGVVNDYLRADMEDVLQAMVQRLNGGDSQIIDARSEDQYLGKSRRARRGGCVPGALNVPYRSLLKKDPVTSCDVLCSPSEMKAILETSGVDCSKLDTIAYCNGGVASTLVLFALHQLGNCKARNYDGSWNEWGNREDLPIASNDSSI